MIDETRIVRNIKAVIRKIKKSKNWGMECIRTKDVVLMLETILNTIAESKVEQPTIQPQGIDKDRLIEFIDDIKDNTMYEDEFDEYSPYEIIAIMDELIDFINQQPTSDGWIPVSEQPPKEPCVYTVEDYSPYTVAKYGEPQRKFLKTLPLGLEMYERIVAWKPVEPQPYKGSE